MSDRTNRNFARMADEIRAGVEKFGEYSSMHEGSAVIREEFDELWDAVRQNDRVSAVSEAIQVAATALRFAIEFDTEEEDLTEGAEP